MQLSFALFLTVGVATAQHIRHNQFGERELGGPPAWSCEVRNAETPFPACSTNGGKKNGDPCMPCCECECDETVVSKSKCVEEDELGCIAPVNDNCNDACAAACVEN